MGVLCRGPISSTEAEEHDNEAEAEEEDTAAVEGGGGSSRGRGVGADALQGPSGVLLQSPRLLLWELRAGQMYVEALWPGTWQRHAMGAATHPLPESGWSPLVFPFFFFFFLSPPPLPFSILFELINIKSRPMEKSPEEALFR